MTSRSGMVAAGHRVTAQAAADILREGGNAFDAAVAAMFTACVPETVLASIGGGGFLMAHEAASGADTLYDFFARTPAKPLARKDAGFHSIHADFGPATQEFHIGAGATAVPGFVQGAFSIHRNLCRMPMTRLLEPAIAAARDGVEMTPFHAYLFTVIAPILTASEGARALFAPRGTLLRTGETFRNPRLAATLEALGREGESLFSEGEIACAIVAQSRDEGGHLTLSDLAGYSTRLREPLKRRHRSSYILLNPAPSSGGTLIAFGLALLDRLPGADRAPTALRMARVMEETGKAREARPEHMLGDDVLAWHLAELRSHARSSRGTTHISIIDGEGNAAAVTISNGEGNGLMVGDHGFMLNNMLGEEDLNPQGFFNWTPGTRLSSMMAPTLLRADDGSITALGSGGSNRIRTALLQVISHLLDRGLDLDDAVAVARLHVERDGTLSYEAEGFSAGWGQEQLDDLTEAYPDARDWPQANMFFGGVHAVRRAADGRLEGAADFRRHGAVATV
ncbi:MAG: gamma-glutamyltransferase [Pseudomonadota bacterium]|nr:gamma-glutamyltransferase [Pseudomonadota bacterium]